MSGGGGVQMCRDSLSNIILCAHFTNYVSTGKNHRNFIPNKRVTWEWPGDEVNRVHAAC